MLIFPRNLHPHSLDTTAALAQPQAPSLLVVKRVHWQSTGAAIGASLAARLARVPSPSGANRTSVDSAAPLARPTYTVQRPDWLT